MGSGLITFLNCKKSCETVLSIKYCFEFTKVKTLWQRVLFCSKEFLKLCGEIVHVKSRMGEQHDICSLFKKTRVLNTSECYGHHYRICQNLQRKRVPTCMVVVCLCVSVLVRSTDYGRMMSRSQILYGQNLHPKPN